MSENNLQDELRKAWESTPLILKVSKENFQIISQENRILILKALNKGIMEKEHGHTRHILTAEEILEYIQKNHNGDIKLTNVYFHLQKLQEGGFIKEVSQIGTGKRPKVVWGRTAKIFLSTDFAMEDLENDDFFLKLFDIIKRIQPKKSLEEIKKPFFEMNSIKWEKEEQFLEKWFIEHKDLIDNIDIDHARLYMYLAKLLDFRNEFIKFNNEISELLNVDKF
jgi:DNA-binding transcriptional ArsR family regulator